MDESTQTEGLETKKVTLVASSARVFNTVVVNG